MGHVDPSVQTLRTEHEELVALRVPRLGVLVDRIDDDFDVDLYYEESEVEGLADAFLAGRELGQLAIILDPTIDDRISAAARMLPGDPTIAAFQIYRELVRRVAVSLSRAADVPIVERSRGAPGG